MLSTAIITREALDASGEIHDRMPVFLERGAWDEWLEPSKLDVDGKDRMLRMLAAESERMATRIQAYDVDPKVNNTRRADPTDATLIQPIR